MALLRLDIINFYSFPFYLFVLHTRSVDVVPLNSLWILQNVLNMAIKREATPQHDILNEIISLEYLFVHFEFAILIYKSLEKYVPRWWEKLREKKNNEKLRYAS